MSGPLPLPYPYTPGAPDSGLGDPAQYADNIQANLDAIATGAMPLGDVSTFIRGLLNDADAATARTTLGAAPAASPTFTGTVTLPSVVSTSSTLGLFGATPVSRQSYGTLTFTTSRGIDAGTITVAQLANVLATLIDDLTKLGAIGPHT